MLLRKAQKEIGNLIGRYGLHWLQSNRERALIAVHLFATACNRLEIQLEGGGPPLIRRTRRDCSESAGGCQAMTNSQWNGLPEH